MSLSRCLLTMCVVGGVYVAGSLGWAAQHPSAPPVNGPLGCDRRELFLGRLAQHAEATATFRLTNLVGEQVHITKVETSCGCTVAEPEKPALSPGESTGLKVTLSTRSLEGPVRKRLSVITMPFSRLALEVTANVVPDFVPDPAVVNLGLVRVGAEVRRAVDLLPGPAAASFSYGPPVSSAAEVTATVHERRVELLARPTRPGPLVGSVALPSRELGKGPLRVPFVGEATP